MGAGSAAKAFAFQPIELPLVLGDFEIEFEFESELASGFQPTLVFAGFGFGFVAESAPAPGAVSWATNKSPVATAAA